MLHALLALVSALPGAHELSPAPPPEGASPAHTWGSIEVHGSFLSDVADRSQIQNTFGYGLQVGHRWRRWGVFIRAEQNLWLASELSRDLEMGAANVGAGVDVVYYEGRMRSALSVGASVLLFETAFDEAGRTGFFVDLRPTGFRWPVGRNATIEWDPLTFTLVAPVLSGIPLLMLEYRTALSVEFRLGGGSP